MKKSLISIGTITILSLGSASALASDLTIPNQFVSGTPAVAADVNDNFTAVETAVDDNDARITTNTSSISTNATAIATKADAVDVTTNTADIATNASNISANAVAIGANNAAIAVKADAADVATNTTDIATNAADVATNTADIATNTADIATNAADIATNTADIATNAADIATNTADIATNATNISGNTSDIADLLAGKTGATCLGNDSNDIMVRVGPLCVDKYEASVWTTFDGSTSGDQFGTAGDDYDTAAVGGVTCSDTGNDCTGSNAIYARSEQGVTPSASITWFQAQQACAASGKRLLTNAEWQMAVSGTPDPGATDDGSTECRVSTGTGATGSRSACVSNWLVNDMVGNVWEWVADWIQGASHATITNMARSANGTGSDTTYNTTVNSPTYSSDSSSNAGANYGNDAMSNTAVASSQGGGSNFLAAIYRGGRSGGGSDSAGTFALSASTAPSGSDPTIGFRCAR